MKASSVAAAMIVVGLVAGCEKAAPTASPEPGTNQVGGQSVVKETVGTMLQYDTLRAGRRTQEKAKQAVSAHNERASDATSVDQ